MTDKTCLLYCRVSTDEQNESGYSIRTQIEACVKYARSLGYTIVGDRWYDLEEKKQVSSPNENTFPIPVYSDDFTGTVPIEYRPEGKMAFDLLRSDRANAIVAYAVDRLVRPPEEGDEWDMPVLIRGLAKLGKEIHTVNRGQLKTDFASLLIAMLEAKSAGDERRKIIERTTRGKNGKAKSGKVVGSGFPPYGYDFAGDSLAINEEQAKVVRMVYLMYAEQRMTMRGIALRLSQLGIEKPIERRKKDPRSTLWSHSSIHWMLISSVYKGDWYYGKVIGESGKGGYRPKDEQIHVSVPAIVDGDVWDAVQRIITQNSEIAARHRRRSYLLSGMVRCTCGCSMAASTHRGVSYYKCNRRTMRHQSLEGRECREPQFGGKNLEKIVWDYIKNLMLGDFEKELCEAQQAERKRNEPLLHELDIVNGLITEVEAEANALIHGLRTASGLMATKLQEEMDRINDRHTTLLTKKGELEAQINAQSLTKAQAESLMEFRNRIVKGIEHATPEDIRHYYEILNVKVVIKDHKVKVSCLIESITS